MYTWIWCAAGSIFLTLLPGLACAGSTDSKEFERRWLSPPAGLHGLVPVPASAYTWPTVTFFWAAVGVVMIATICVLCCWIYSWPDTQKPRLPQRATASSRSKYSELGTLTSTAKKPKVVQKALPYPRQNYYQSEGAPYPQRGPFVHEEMAPSRKASTVSMPQPPTALKKPLPPY